jgi:hypothetical protein
MLVVMAVAASFPPGQEPEAVLLDLVQPARPGRRADEGLEARRITVPVLRPLGLDGLGEALRLVFGEALGAVGFPQVAGQVVGYQHLVFAFEVGDDFVWKLQDILGLSIA